MEPKIASIRSSVIDTGCNPPALLCRPGKETSRDSALSCACNSAVASACRRSLSAASIACLVRLTAAPRDFFSSTLSEAKPFIKSVTRPDLPRKIALAFSRSAGVAAPAKLFLAANTSSSRASDGFIIFQWVRVVAQTACRHEKGPELLQAPAHVFIVAPGYEVNNRTLFKIKPRAWP